MNRKKSEPNGSEKERIMGYVDRKVSIMFPHLQEFGCQTNSTGTVKVNQNKNCDTEEKCGVNESKYGEGAPIHGREIQKIDQDGKNIGSDIGNEVEDKTDDDTGYDNLEHYLMNNYSRKPRDRSLRYDLSDDGTGLVIISGEYFQHLNDFARLLAQPDHESM